MRHLFFIGLVILVLMSCQSQQDKPVTDIISKKESIEQGIVPMDSLEYFKKDTLKRQKELGAGQLPISNWQELQFYKAVAYGITKGEGGDLFQFRDRSFAYELSKLESAYLLKTIRDTSSFPEGRSASCFNPNMGIVFYDFHSKIQAYMEICLSCNNLCVYPNKIGKKSTSYIGLSLKVRQQLKPYCEKWGMPRCPTETSPYDFENPEEHRDY